MNVNQMLRVGECPFFILPSSSNFMIPIPYMYSFRHLSCKLLGTGLGNSKESHFGKAKTQGKWRAAFNVLSHAGRVHCMLEREDFSGER